MQHATLQVVRPVNMSPAHLSAAVEHTSRSSTSSPRSQKTPVESSTSQTTQSSVPVHRHELTPPSSIASSHDPQDERTELQVIGKKRTASGEIKGHSRSMSTSSANLAELSQSLRTKLSYAMVKVQNGWQSNTLDEVESLASQSPRSAFSGFRDRSLVSPRVALAAMRQSNHLHNISLDGFKDTSDITPRKGLAPSATIVPSRRRLNPNGHLQINTMKPPCRPTTQQRTPSQNAAMEADAVETLLFMSASPNNSGRFPSMFSPISQTFSAQTSPLKSQFSPDLKRPNRPYEDRAVLIDRLLNDLDDDTNDELDEAVRILEQHRAAKLAT